MLAALWLVTPRELEALRHEPSDPIGPFPLHRQLRCGLRRSLRPWHRPTGRSELQSFLGRHTVGGFFRFHSRVCRGGCRRAPAMSKRPGWAKAAPELGSSLSGSCRKFLHLGRWPGSGAPGITLGSAAPGRAVRCASWKRSRPEAQTVSFLISGGFPRMEAAAKLDAAVDGVEVALQASTCSMLGRRTAAPRL